MQSSGGGGGEVMTPSGTKGKAAGAAAGGGGREPPVSDVHRRRIHFVVYLSVLNDLPAVDGVRNNNVLPGVELRR